MSVLVPPLPAISKAIASEWLSAVKEVSDSRNFYPSAENELLTQLQWSTLGGASPSQQSFVERFNALRRSDRFDPEFFQPRFVLIESLLSEQKALPFSELVLQYIKGVQPSAYDTEGDIVVIKSKDVLKAGINITIVIGLTRHRSKPILVQ